MKIDLLWDETSTEPMLSLELPDSELGYRQTNQCFRGKSLYVLVVPSLVILSKEWLNAISHIDTYLK